MKQLIIALFLLVATGLALGQGTSAQPPKPGPEHQKLAGLVGEWTTEGEATETPFGPAEKWSGKITSEWLPGNFAVLRHVDENFSVTGKILGLDVITYDGTAKTFTWYEVDNRGGTELDKASISGEVLTVSGENEAKGRIYKVRGTLKGLGSDRLSWVGEYSEDTAVWKTYQHSTDIRVKSR
jgi:hypothetical protein